MKESGNPLPTCKATAFTNAVIKACDRTDGVTDGVIGRPDRCRWDPATLVGTKTACGTITAKDALVIKKIWEGPTTRAGKKLWYGLEPGTPLTRLANSSTAGGTLQPVPFPIAEDWLRFALQKNPDWDWRTLTFAEFEQLFAQSVREFSGVIATDDPDLSAFARHGGKVVIWHGLTDELIFPKGTINYYERVQNDLGVNRTRSFARLFLAPGALHCRSGAGPAPTDPLAAVVAWVEEGKAPAKLAADLVDPATGKTTRSRILCPYPANATYSGRGSTDDARNFRCT